MKKNGRCGIGMPVVKRMLAIVLSAVVLMQQMNVYAVEAAQEDTGTVSTGDLAEPSAETTVSAGDATVSSGDATVSAGNATVSDGDVSGNMPGDVSDNVPVFVPYDFNADDYVIEFSTESGVSGSAVEATLRYTGAESRDELCIVWRTDESKLVPRTQTDHGTVLSVKQYEVIANEVSAQKVYADLYHEECYIGTVESGDFMLKKDNHAPSVESVYYATGSQGVVELQEAQHVFGSSNLILMTNVADVLGEQEDEAVSGIHNVWVYVNRQNYAMTYNAESGMWEVEIGVPEHKYTNLKPCIFVTDKAGNEFSKELPKFSLDREKPTLQLSLTNGEETVSGWYSETLNGYTLKIQIEAGDRSRLQRIEIATDADFANIVETISCTAEASDTAFVAQTGDGVISGDQNQTYYVRVYDEWGNYVSGSIQVTIDNAAPQNDVEVSFCGTEDMLIQFTDEGNGSEYIISRKQGCVYDKDEISLVLTMQDTLQNNIASGVMAVDFMLQITDGVTGEITQTPIHIDADSLYITEDGRTGLYYCMEIPDNEVFEKSFQICDLYITDKAGNVCPGSVEENIAGIQDRVLYYIDNSAPRVDYTYGTAEIAAGLVEQTEAGVYHYFNQPFTADITVVDANLNETEVENVLSEDNEQAQITQVNGIAGYQYTLEADGKYQLSVKADDILHNGSTGGEMLPVLSDFVILDTVMPEIKLNVCNGAGEAVSGYANHYFAQDMIVSMQITEPYLVQDSIRVSVSGITATGEVISLTMEPGSWTANGSVYTNQYLCTQEGYYTVSVTCTDKAGNSNTLATEGFYIDKTAPVATIVYDNNTPSNGFYYNAARTATVTVSDYAFDNANVQYLMESVYGSEAVIGEWSHHPSDNCDGSRHTADCSYTAQVVFEKDDIYDFSFVCTDKAGLTSAAIANEHFTVDKTAPVITITFDNNAAANGYFYNVARTAYIQVSDISFDANLVNVVKSGEQADNLPGLSAFNSSGTTYTASMNFAQDGVYQFSADATDLAGNKAEVRYCPLFIVDMTAPEILISGVGAYSANNGVVMPQVEYHDKYLNDAESAFSISGYYHGAITKDFAKEAVAEGYLITYEDFAYTQQTDDLYTLHVNIRDYAGNESTGELVFSVNRFGSVYVLGEESKAALEDYYLAESPELIVSEINVDDLKEYQVTCSLDGITTTLTEGIHYFVEKEGAENTWKSYDYIFHADNFGREGYYALTITSTDAATNDSDNRSSGTEITFAVDKTAPSIVAGGIASGNVYHAEQMTVRADVKDNMGLGYVAIYDGTRLLQEYYEEALATNMGELSFKLTEAKDARDIRIVARDLAGNEQELIFEDVTISTDVSLLTDAIAPLASAIMDGESGQKPMRILWTVLLVSVVAFAGTGALWLVKRRRNR